MRATFGALAQISTSGGGIRQVGRKMFNVPGAKVARLRSLWQPNEAIVTREGTQHRGIEAGLSRRLESVGMHADELPSKEGYFYSMNRVSLVGGARPIQHYSRRFQSTTQIAREAAPHNSELRLAIKRSQKTHWRNSSGRPGPPGRRATIHAWLSSIRQSS